MSPTLGQQLKEAREQQGLALADVAHKTRIPVPRLQDLESDHYVNFGSPTYVRCFLQTYAGFLGVDPRPVTDQLSPPAPGKAKDYPYLTRRLGRWVDPAPSKSLMTEARPVRASRAMTAFVVGLFAMILVAGAMWAKAFFTDHRGSAIEIRPALRGETGAPAEEVRPAVASPGRDHPPGYVPIRRALPVEDDPPPAPARSSR